MDNTINLLELERYIGSIQYTIPTKQIMDLQTNVNEWMSMNECGAIIYGKSRSGKSRSIHYITTKIKEKYGESLPVYNFCATDHVPTNKTFYSSLLSAIGHEDFYRGTAVQMRERLVNRIIQNSINTTYRRAVLFVDEAYLLHEKEYIWLIDIYNELNKNDILLTVFLFGTHELKEQRTGFIRSHKEQIVLRFMSHEYEFKGISSQKDLVVCMTSLDKPFQLHNNGPSITLSEMFFPEAYKDGKRMQAFAMDLWEAFEKVKEDSHIITSEILMKHFMDTIIYCLKTFGSYGKQLYMPTQAEWIASINKIGFASLYAAA